MSSLDRAERDPDGQRGSAPTPCALSANATAALATPTLPGVSGRIPARSSAGMMSTAGASGRSTPNAAAIPAALQQAERHREPDPAGDLRGGASGSCRERGRHRGRGRTCCRDAVDVRARRRRGDENAEQREARSASAAARPTRDAEREQEREPQRPDGPDGGRDPTDRPEPSFVRQRAGKESEANCGPDLGGREAFTTEPVQYRAAIGARRRAAAARSADLQAGAPTSAASRRSRRRRARARPASASESPSIPAPTRSPSSCGVSGEHDRGADRSAGTRARCRFPSERSRCIL